jgi:hypothetical protein
MLFSLQYSSTAGQKQLENQSLNTAWVTHAFLIDREITGSDLWLYLSEREHLRQINKHWFQFVIALSIVPQ